MRSLNKNILEAVDMKPITSSAWSCLISSLCHKSSNRIDEALDCLHDMQMFDGITPTADTCNPIFQALGEQSDYKRLSSLLL